MVTLSGSELDVARSYFLLVAPSCVIGIMYLIVLSTKLSDVLNISCVKPWGHGLVSSPHHSTSAGPLFLD